MRMAKNHLLGILGFHWNNPNPIWCAECSSTTELLVEGLKEQIKPVVSQENGFEDWEK